MALIFSHSIIGVKPYIITLSALGYTLSSRALNDRVVLLEVEPLSYFIGSRPITRVGLSSTLTDVEV
jgi:hypothetical protein